MVYFNFLFNDLDTASKIQKVVSNTFEMSNTISVELFCKWVVDHHGQNLLNPTFLEHIKQTYAGCEWHKHTIEYCTRNGLRQTSIFSINAPIPVEDPIEALKRMYPPIPIDKKKKENNMKIDITDVNSYNDRVVIVRFSDGTFTKSICSEKDTFDLDIGISLCLLKKFMSDTGTGSYANLMRRIHKMMDRNDKAKRQAIADKAERRKLQEERHQRNIAKATKKAKDTYGDIIREAFLEAMKEVDNE